MGTEKRPSGWMRDELPGVAAIFDEFRAVFGAETINEGLRQMIKDGEFYAEDFVTGNKIGKPPVVKSSGVGRDGTQWVVYEK